MARSEFPAEKKEISTASIHRESKVEISEGTYIQMKLKLKDTTVNEHCVSVYLKGRR